MLDGDLKPDVDLDGDLLGEEEQEFLDNVSWDTSSNEEDAEGDKKVLAESRMPAKGLNFHKADADSETERKAKLNQTTESDYYDFYFHDFKKNYMEPSKEYLRYRELQNHKAALEEKDVSDD